MELCEMRLRHKGFRNDIVGAYYLHMLPFSLQGNFGYDIMINRPNKLACDEITRSGAEVS